MNPEWYGKRYPSIDDLEAHAWDLGGVVVEGPISTAFYYSPKPGECPVIGLPSGLGPLEKAWLLAHELGHLCQHLGPKGELFYAKNEAQADRWAACALIPEKAIRRYQNASEDAFIAALSKHYEDLPQHSTPTRRLAGRIARVRLQILNNREEVL